MVALQTSRDVLLDRSNHGRGLTIFWVRHSYFLLWALQRYSVSVEDQLKVTRALLRAALTATVAPVAWVFAFSEVFFVAGGSR